MSHNGQLIRTGIYKNKENINCIIFAHVIHSETNQQYMLATHDKSKGAFCINLMGNFMHNYTLAESYLYPDILEHLALDIEIGTYEHYKSNMTNRKLYNVLGSAAIDSQRVVVYYPLYGSQTLMARPMHPVHEADKSEGAFLQNIIIPEIDYDGPRFMRIGELS